MADPPWPYDNKEGSGYDVIPKQKLKTTENALQHSVREMGYSGMSIADLKAIPVASWCEENAHLYLWVTNSFMVEGHEIARAWGFKPKTILTWVKTHQDNPQRVSMKTGYYFRGATEHVIFAVRGSLALQTSEGVPTAFLWPRINRHSEKPDGFRNIVEKCSPGPYLEMFARTHRDGWDVWGNEAPAESQMVLVR